MERAASSGGWLAAGLLHIFQFGTQASAMTAPFRAVTFAGTDGAVSTFVQTTRHQTGALERLSSYAGSSVFAMERRAILMASKARPSETLAWLARAAQARRVAGMLSPRDAQLAEAYPVKCEDQAREASSDGLRSARSALAQSVANPIPNSTGRGSPKQLLFCED
jgi:hypothetical protein